MIIYVILLSIIIFESIICYKSKNENKQKIYLIIIGILLILVSGLRDKNIGVDTASYVNFFQNVSNLDNSQLNSIYYEKGFILFNKFLVLFSNHYSILLVISTLIIIIPILLFIKENSNSIWMSVYLFVTLTFYYNSMNIMRQYIAIGLILLSYSYVKKRKIIPFVFLVFLSASFHTTALVFLIVYFIPLIKLSYRKLNYLILFTLIIYLFFPYFLKVFFNYFRIYTGYIYYLDSMNFGDILKFLIMFLILLFGIYFKYPNFQANKSTFINDENLQTIIIIIGTIFSFLAIRMSILSRITDYFFIFSIIYIPNVLKTIINPKLKLFVTYFVIIICLIYNFAILIYRPEWFNVTPYNFYWN